VKEEASGYFGPSRLRASGMQVFGCGGVGGKTQRSVSVSVERKRGSSAPERALFLFVQLHDKCD